MSNPGEKWAELLEQAPCGLLELDSDYAIRLANGYLSNLLGRTFAELQGQKFYNLLTVPGRILVQTWVWPKLDLAGQVEELALDFVRADGERIPVLLNASQPHDAQGRPGYIRMAITRAAAKRAYEAEVPKARQAAASASRVKGDFLANVSHEIRTPLNGMLGVAGALAQTELAPAQREMVELIQSSGAMLERLLADILDVSKVDAGGLEVETRPLELRRELDGVLGLARSRAVEKGLLFTALYGPATEGWFNGDATRLKQVLGNLTSNALKFTEAGEVCVEVDIEGSGPDCELVLTVEDTGIGFDDTQSDVLFKRFQQADGGITRRYGGTGLGLTICKALVEAMGGSISVRSRPGDGSRFEVRVPLPASEPPSVAGETQPLETELRENLRVLLVEDNATNRKVVDLILSPLGVKLTTAENGALGVETWRSGVFDLVLMDMQMPVMDGLSAIRLIRAEEAPDRRIPIAVLSANAMADHRRQALEAGADLHIAKPVTPAALLAGIELVLGQDRKAA